MPRYTYVALDARGQESTGLVDANSTNEAIGQLRQAGYFPTNVFEEGKATGREAKAVKQKKTKAVARRCPGRRRRRTSSSSSARRVKPRVLMIFTRQLATLIDAGLPLLRALTVLAKQERDKVLQRTIGSLGDAVQGGSTFSEGLAQHPKIFNDLYVNMVRAGELGGVLELVLTRLAEFQEKAQKIKNKVVAAMVYPIIVMFLAIAIMAFLLVFIVPRFEQIFKDMLGDKPLPAITLFVIGVSNAVKNHWPIIIGVDFCRRGRNQTARPHDARAPWRSTAQVARAALWRSPSQDLDLALLAHARHARDQRCPDSSGLKHHA